MPRSKTPSFVTDIPLVVDSATERELLSRFQAGRQFYNACLGEVMARMELVRDSETYQLARKLSKGKARSDVFSAARTAYRYSEYALHSFAKLTADRSRWISEKLDTNTQQTLATVHSKPVKEAYSAALKRFDTKCRRAFGRWKVRRTSKESAGQGRA